jgi:hypothetical protein
MDALYIARLLENGYPPKAAAMQLRGIAAAPQAPAQPPAPVVPTEVRMLDWLEQKRLTSRAKGFQWDSWTYDALQSDKTIREQIATAMGKTIPATKEQANG